MTDILRISCIQRTYRKEVYERIQFIGGLDAAGSIWQLSQLEAVEAIEAGKWRFWVGVAGKNVWVTVAVDHHGNKYLKAEGDGEEPTRLLDLPDCPGERLSSKEGEAKGDAKEALEALRELLRPEPPDARNAFRLEDWNEWPERWRQAFEVVRKAAKVDP